MIRNVVRFELAVGDGGGSIEVGHGRGDGADVTIVSPSGARTNHRISREDDIPQLEADIRKYLPNADASETVREILTAANCGSTWIENGPRTVSADSAPTANPAENLCGGTQSDAAANPS